MRHLVSFVCLMAGFAALPVSATAQDAEEVATPEPSAEEPAPTSEPAPEQPALQLQLDDAGVGIAPSPRRTALEEAIRLRAGVKRAKIGLYASAGVLVVGGLIAMTGTLGDCFLPDTPPTKCAPLAVTGAALAGGGIVGMTVSGTMLGVRKRKLRRLWDPNYGRPRRVQWDLTRSRVVF